MSDIVHRAKPHNCRAKSPTNFASFSVSQIPAVFRIVSVFRIVFSKKNIGTAQVPRLHFRQGNKGEQPWTNA